MLKAAKMHENDIAHQSIGAAIEVHKSVGPGLLESAYENALAYDLRLLGFDVQQQVSMPFVYREVKMEVGYRIDLLINFNVKTLKNNIHRLVNNL